MDWIICADVKPSWITARRTEVDYNIYFFQRSDDDDDDDEVVLKNNFMIFYDTSDKQQKHNKYFHLQKCDSSWVRSISQQFFDNIPLLPMACYIQCIFAILEK